MNKEILEALNQLTDKFGIAVDWSNQNALPYLRDLMGRLVRYEIITSVVWLIIGALFVLSAIWWLKFIKYARKKYEEIGHFNDWDVAANVATFAMIIVVLLGIIIVLCQIDDIIQCVVLPEGIILKYIKGVTAS
jgi:hypothetical protein